MISQKNAAPQLNKNQLAPPVCQEYLDLAFLAVANLTRQMNRLAHDAIVYTSARLKTWIANTANTALWARSRRNRRLFRPDSGSGAPVSNHVKLPP